MSFDRGAIRKGSDGEENRQFSTPCLSRFLFPSRSQPRGAQPSAHPTHCRAEIWGTLGTFLAYLADARSVSVADGRGKPGCLLGLSPWRARHLQPPSLATRSPGTEPRHQMKPRESLRARSARLVPSGEAREIPPTPRCVARAGGRGANSRRGQKRRLLRPRHGFSASAPPQA